MTSPPTPRLDSLTGLRFAAAFLVFGFHAHTVGLVDEGPAGAGMSWLFGQGAVGVSFFFLLSGFVLTWSARPGDTVRRFWQRRIAKIYPNHLVTWGAALGAALAAGVTVSAAVALPALLLVQAWVPSEKVYFGVNPVSWSLACEVFFYALFPMLHRIFARLPGRALWPAAATALATVWAVPVAAGLLPDRYQYWAIWLLPVSRLPEFVAGMLLARVVAEGRWPKLGVAPAVMVTVAAYTATRWLPENFRFVAGTVVPLALLVAAVAACDAAGRPTLWRSRWAVRLGEVSYAFYLVHLLALTAVVKVAGDSHSPLVEVGLAAAGLVLSLPAGWLLYRVVELPAMRRLGPRRASLSYGERDADAPEPVGELLRAQ